MLVYPPMERGGRKLIHLKSGQPEVETQDRGGGVLMATQHTMLQRAGRLQPEAASAKPFPLPTEGNLCGAERLFPGGSALLQISIRKGPSLGHERQGTI